MAFFDDLAAMTRDLLKPDTEGGLGSSAGSIVLVREAPGTPDPAEPWEPVEPTTTQQTLKAHSFGVPQKMIDGETILMGDQMVISEVPSISWKQDTGVTVRIEIDTVPWQIISAQPIPAAGTPSAIKFIIRK